MSNRLTLAFLIIAVSLGFLYFVAPVCAQNPVTCFGNPQTATAPGVYRLLQPAIENLLAPQATKAELLLADTWLQMVIVALALPALFTWLRRWGSAEAAIQGVFVFAVVWILAQHYWYRSLNASLEILFMVGALILIERGWLWIAVLMVLASFNRETGILLASLYAAYYWREKTRESIALVLIWTVITAGIHIVIGTYPHMLGLSGTLFYNLNNLPDAVIANLLLAPLVIATALGYRHAPTRLQRLTLVSLVYVAAVFVGGAWGESQRLLLPVLPLVLPVMVSNWCISEKKTIGIN